MEEGIEWNSALTAAVTMATEEGMKKDNDEISGKVTLSVCLCHFFPFPLPLLETKVPRPGMLQAMVMQISPSLCHVRL